MKPNYVKLLIFFTLIGISLSRRYDNFTLYTTNPTEQFQLSFLQNLESQKYMDVKFWKRPSKLFNDVHFIVNPMDLGLFEERVEHFKLDVRILQHDIQR